MKSDAIAVPLVPGENCTFTDALWPELRFKGVVRPEAANPEPLTLIDVIVRVVPLPFVTWTGSVRLAPTAMSPNDRLAGATVTCPGADPEPVRLTVYGVDNVDAETVNVPVRAPAAVGANTIATLQLAFGASADVHEVVIRKSAPETLMLLIVTGALAPFVSVSELELLLPTGTVPNATLVAFIVNVPVGVVGGGGGAEGGCEFGVLPPPQAVATAQARSAAASRARPQENLLCI
jgi:hypothetical protein